MSNIIDFNRHKRGRDGAPREEEYTLDALMERMDSLPDNALMASVAEYTNQRMFKQLMLMDLGRQVTELLQSIGLDPDGFGIDEESADRFMASEDLTDGQTAFNGPFFDWFDDGAVVRVATAFQDDEDDEDDVNLLMAVMKLEDGADRWQRWGDSGWIDDGPPADFFDDLAFDGGFDDDEDWEDEDDDELFQQEPWEDEYDESIYSLYLMPQTIRALSGAGIETIRQLAALTDLELLAIDGIDAKALEIIHDALDDEDLEAGE